MMKKKICVIACLFSLTIQAVYFVVPKGWHQKEIPLEAQKRLGNYPYLTGDTFRNACDFIIDETQIPFNPAAVKKGDLIFVNANYLKFFFETIYPAIEVPFILVTHNSVHPAGGIWAHYLDDPKLLAWIGKNISIKNHPKLFPLPLGIANKHWPHGNAAVIEQVSHQTQQKDKLLYVNFDVNTNSDRTEVQQYFLQQDFCYITGKKPFVEYLQDLKRSIFVASPEGRSIDCHRTWEALMLGCIPIVTHSTIDSVFDGLPVVFVNSWKEVTREFLEKKYKEMQSKSYDLHRLHADYWIGMMHALKKQHQDSSVASETITTKFCDFFESMECVKHKLDAIKAKSEWILAKKLYDKHIKNYILYNFKPRIPKIIHQIWLGSELPESCKKLQQTWTAMHPGWDYILWTEKEIESFGLKNKKLYDQTTNYGQKSDIARYEILYKLGGLYVDTDFECKQSFDTLHHCLDFYTGTAYGPEFSVYNGLIGCAPGHPVMKACIDTLSISDTNNTNYGVSILKTSGPYHLTRCLLNYMPTCQDATVAFPVGYFYPWPNSHRLENSPEQIARWFRPETLAVHHWHVAWHNGIAPVNQKIKEFLSLYQSFYKQVRRLVGW